MPKRELQCRVDDTDRLQYEAYAGPGEQPHWQLFPELTYSGRRYLPASEGELWKIKRLNRHLARYVVRRKVYPRGKVSMYNRPQPGSRACIGKVVSVGFDAEDCCWGGDPR